jgi:hypothetical protein
MIQKLEYNEANYISLWTSRKLFDSLRREVLYNNLIETGILKANKNVSE